MHELQVFTCMIQIHFSWNCNHNHSILTEHIIAIPIITNIEMEKTINDCRVTGKARYGLRSYIIAYLCIIIMS